MLKVECEGCRAPYRVDERRVPPGGLKMRCPKCGATFMVKKGDPNPAPPTREHPAPPPPSLRTDDGKRTVMGIGLAAGARAAAAHPAPPDDLDAGLPVVAPSGIPDPRATDDDLDLPVVGRSSRFDFDLPSPARPAPASPSPGRGGADRPAPLFGAGFRTAARPRPAPAPVRPAPDDDLADFGDLPLPVANPALGDRPVPVPPAFEDLPLPAPPAFEDLPLPVRDADSHLDFPMPAELADLPSLGKPASKDRPARQITGAALGFGEDLGLTSPAAPRTSQPDDNDFSDGFGELDLPLAPDADLPANLNPDANLPSPFSPLHNLPMPSDSRQNLPVPSDGRQNLPLVLDGQRNLPTALDEKRRLSPLGLQQQLPARHDSANEYDLEVGLDPVGPAPVRPASPAPAAFPYATPVPLVPGSLPPGQEFPGPGAPSTDAFGSFDSIPSPDEGGDADAQVTRQAGGGISFGEVNLLDDGGGSIAPDVGEAGSGATPSFGERDLAGGNDDDMEFGAIPQESEDPGPSNAAIEAGPVVAPAGVPSFSRLSVPSPAMRKKSKGMKLLLVSLLVGVGGGIALSATPFGAFGINLISDTMNAGRNERLLETATQNARTLFAADTAEGATQALNEFDQAISKAPRHATLAAYAAFLGFVREVRFGADPAVHAHAIALLKDASERSPENATLPLARAAEAAADGEVAKARQAVAALARRDAQNVDVAVLQGEIELLAGEYKSAQNAWERAGKLEDSARAAFGRARSLEGLGDLDNAKKEADKALAITKNHVGARLLLARFLRSKGDTDKASALLLEIVGGKEAAAGVHEAASKEELVETHTLLGQLHLERSRMSASEEAFAEALKLNPKDAAALCGFGEVLYREGRFAEALARYEAGIQANPESVAAKIGAAKTKIALERLQEAKELLRKLRETRPADPIVAYWLAKAEEALGNKPEVEKILVDAIGREPKGMAAIDLYVALAQFLAAQGRMQEADEKLAEARRKLPDSPAIHKALGNVALAAGRLNEAKKEFETALQRDTNDLSSVFNLGVTLRRMGRFDEAQERFDQVATVDKNYPGLALERGVLFEAAGQAQRALEMYQEALSKAPNDPDLMLRVGSAEVASGHASQAEEILRKVLHARPNSAEANHYLGRAQLLKGNNLAEALRYLRRAAEIDPNRAEYWLYIGWAANDAGQPGTAEKALKKSLELDQSLADAYWQRGILLRRQGAVRDAERDLTQALELKPSRFEAHATLAECYEDQSRWEAATTSWKKAIAADGNRPFWRYKLGRLFYNGHNRAGAAEELKRAVQLAAKESRPPWLWEAYLMLADASRTGGRRAEAIEYYREYLKLAPPDSPFRADAIKALQGLGAPWEG